MRTKRDIVKSVKSATFGRLWASLYRSVLILLIFCRDVSSTIPDTAHSAVWVDFFLSFLLLTSPAHRFFRLFLCAKRRPGSWNLFSASSQTLLQGMKALCTPFFLLFKRPKPPHDQTIKLKKTGLY